MGSDTECEPTFLCGERGVADVTREPSTLLCRLLVLREVFLEADLTGEYHWAVRADLSDPNSGLNTRAPPHSCSNIVTTAVLFLCAVLVSVIYTLLQSFLGFLGALHFTSRIGSL